MWVVGWRHEIDRGCRMHAVERKVKRAVIGLEQPARYVLADVSHISVSIFTDISLISIYGTSEPYLYLSMAHRSRICIGYISDTGYRPCHTYPCIIGLYYVFP
jgi:hypothetical protein